MSPHLRGGRDLSSSAHTCELYTLSHLPSPMTFNKVIYNTLKYKYNTEM